MNVINVHGGKVKMEVVYSAGILFARYYHEEFNSVDLYKSSPF